MEELDRSLRGGDKVRTKLHHQHCPWSLVINILDYERLKADIRLRMDQ